MKRDVIWVPYTYADGHTEMIAGTKTKDRGQDMGELIPADQTYHGTATVGGAGLGGGVFKGFITFDDGYKLDFEGWFVGIEFGGIDSLTCDVEWAEDPHTTAGTSAWLNIAIGGFVGGGLVASFSRWFSAVGHLSAAGLGLGLGVATGSCSFTEGQ